MEYIYQEGLQTAPPLLLLHGTGGDEHSLIDLANALSPDSTVLSLRGRVSEAGANRFFRRFAEGQFDLVDLEVQTDYLLAFLIEFSDIHNIALYDWVVVGYSNGANIGAHLLLERMESPNRGIFFHGMSLGKHEADFDLAKKSVWFSAGINDPIVPQEATKALVDAFQMRHGQTDVLWTKQGHQLTYEEVASAKEWLATKGALK